MKHDYPDITSRISETPLWYDSNGVPRYAPFSPRLCPNIYANDVVLMRIICQDCGRSFDVEMHGDSFHPIGELSELHYGDPPCHGCVGDSMNCIDIAIVESWQNERFDWVRHKEQEVLFP